MTNKIILIVFFVLSSTILLGYLKETFTLKELNNPSTIIMNNEYIFIVDDSCIIKTYATKDYTFLKQIGRKGEGPGEFIGHIYPNFYKNQLLITSENKLSFFSLEGNLIKEKKQNLFDLAGIVKPIREKFVGTRMLSEDNYYIGYTLFNSELKPLKELYRGKHYADKKTKKRGLFQICFFDTCKDRIVIAHHEGFVVEIFDYNGKSIKIIQRKCAKIPFTKKDHNAIIKYWEIYPPYRFNVEFFKRVTIFPKNYPDILTCCVADNKIYIFTYMKKNAENKCFIYDLQGNYIKDIFIEIKMLAPNTVAPFTIYKEYFYQLTEDIEKETWILHKIKIK